MNARDEARAAAQLEADRRRVAAKHAATNPTDEPVYDAKFYAEIIAAREVDEASDSPKFVPIGKLTRHAATIARANVDEQYFYGLCDSDDSAQGMMGDRD